MTGLRTDRLAIALAAALTAVSAAAAPAGGSEATRNYIDAAGQSDAFEMLEAKTALAQSGDPQVRQFAERMLADHARLADNLRRATAQAGIASPPMGLGADQAPLLGALQSLRGAEFDKAYWRHQALAHRAALTATQGYAAKGDDAMIRQAATAAIPTIAGHLAMAERMVAADGS